jgi:hypothetical protein
MARAADVRYDGATGHGYTQGAEHSDVPVLEAATETSETPKTFETGATSVAASLASTPRLTPLQAPASVV